MALKRAVTYPKLNRTGDGDILSNRVYDPAGPDLATFIAELPTIGDESLDLAGTYLTDIETERAENGRFWYANLKYQSLQLYNFFVKFDGDTEYELEDGGLRNPLPLHPDYVWCWDHHATSRADAAPWVDPCSYGSDIVENADSAAKYRWIKTLSELPTEPNGQRWFLVLERQKPFDEYLTSSPIVAMRKYYKTKSTAIANATIQEVGVLKVPGERFGIGDGTDAQWLIIAKGLLFDGKYWVLTVRYQWAIAWDTDIYDIGT